MGREKTRQRLAIRKAFAPKKKIVAHQKQHKFESFSARVSRLRIDPIRRDRGYHNDADLSALDSHFQISLEKWRDLNLSEDFTAFAKKVERAGWCDSLPQVLHHQDAIVDELLASIEKSSAVSAEPFLDLVAHLAQDLQNQYAERHFERTVKVVAAVAARHQEVEVVEWCFNCLTWLFKYLERILATDIIPLYDLLAPYLGKERQKPFVSRFAAQSLSFLVKRVGKKKDAVSTFVRHALQDVDDMAKEKDTELYEHSLIALFLEALKSVKESLHSTAPAIFSALLEETLALQAHDGTTNAPARIIREIFHQLLHHTSAENMDVLIKQILSTMSVDDGGPGIDSDRIILTAQLLLLATSVKNGHRVASWSDLHSTLRSQIDKLTASGPENHKRAALELLGTLAVAHQNCPLDAALSSLGTIDKVCSKEWQMFFLGFCNLYAEHGTERFKSFLLARLQRFMLHHWDGVTRPLSILVPTLVAEGAVASRSLKLPDALEKNDIWNDLERYHQGQEINELDCAITSGYLALCDVTAPSIIEKHSGHLLLTAVKAWFPIPGLSSTRALVLGDLFLQLVEVYSEDTAWKLVPLIFHAAPAASGQVMDFPPFWKALAIYRQKVDTEDAHPSAVGVGLQGLVKLDSARMQQLRTTCLQCASSTSHEIRLAALQILKTLVPWAQQDVRSQLDDAIDVENTEPNIDSMRYMSMKIKNLGMAYKHHASFSAILAEAIPRWLFGILHVKLAQIWDDACAALKEISETKEGEGVITEVAFEWLADAPIRDSPIVDVANQSQSSIVPEDYFSQLHTTVQKTLNFADQADEILLARFRERHARVPLLTSFNRAQALRVLKAVPQLAEKKSRQLVPILLSWNSDTGAADDLPDDASDDSPSTLQNTPLEAETRWPRKDQKSLLSLFASFNNPRVLYKAEDVYSTLMVLLAHGDAEIQKSALQAVLAWGDKTLKKHKDDLLKFLDDARLREQLSIFLDNSGADQTNGLPAEDREVVMPVVLRLVYGRIIARSRNERGSNRKSVFVILSKFSTSEIEIFLDMMLAPMIDSTVHVKRQLGMLNMIRDLLEVWKSTAKPWVGKLAPPVMKCLFASSEGGIAGTLQAKSVAGIAMQCLNLLFEAGEEYEWTPWMPQLFGKVLDARMEKFAVENAQGVSSLIRMFGIWAASPVLVTNLFKQRDGLIPAVVEILGLPFAKEVVKRYVLNEVLKPFVGHAEMNEEVEKAVKDNSVGALEVIASLLGMDNSKELTEDAVSVITALTPYTTSCPSTLLSAAARLVQQPAKKVPHHTKTELLAIILHFFSSLDTDSEVRAEVFAAACSSFAYFSDGKSRSLLVSIAKKFASQDGDLGEVIALLDGINAFAPGRLDLPDFDKRAEAFAAITETRWKQFSVKQWRLLLGNLLFYIKDEEELAIRASASHALKRFVEAATLMEDLHAKQEMKAMILGPLLGAIEAGLRDQSELVQIEYLSVLAEVAKQATAEDATLYDLRHLLMGGDEEANLFNNLLHVQQHRRVRAMNRLASVAATGNLSSRNLYRFLWPLIEGFVMKSKDGVVMAEAMKCLGNLVEALDWQQVRNVVRRYTGWVKSKEDRQETVLKLLDGVVGGVERSAAKKVRSSAGKLEDNDNESGIDATEEVKQASKLSKTMPGTEKMTQYIVDDVLPPLSIFLRERDESFVSRRISVALIAAKFVHLFPEEEFRIRFPPLLTDVCNILRSKDQGSRDMTRRALSSMCTLIGPSSFGFILRELRTALQRGFYLHVLAFSVHSILEQTMSNFQPGDLDYCVDDIVDVVVEDVFGNTGKEKDLQEYKADKNTKKEVKGKKSFDTMQLVASVTSLSHLVRLVRPLQGLLGGHLSVKEVRYVDELLRRVELGVLQNASLKNRDVLLFCYEIVKEAQGQAPVPQQARKPDRKSSAGLVESAYLKPAARDVSKTSLHRSEASGKIIRFALEMMRSILKKSKDLLTPGNLSGFMPILGDALLSTNEDVKLAAIRLFTAIIAIPLPRIDEDAPVYISEAARIVEDGQSSGSELEQASLKLISAILRERKSATVKVRAKTISILLKRMKGDLQIISQQGAAFNLLRSIIGRQIIVPELYEIMDGEDGVAAISVRDHDRTTRDLARSVYFQFLMDCPQGEKRWAKQLAFLRGNLEYEYAEGRRSVMDTVLLLLGKVGDDVVKDVVKEMFWPLVGVMVNDADDGCRALASKLVTKIFERATEDWIEGFLDLVEKLLKQGNAIQKRTALQSWELYLKSAGRNAQTSEVVLRSIETILSPAEFDAEQWQLSYWALHTFHAIVQFKEEVPHTQHIRDIWTDARRYLNFPHLWVKQQAVDIFTSLFEQLRISSETVATLPLKGLGSTALSAKDACELAYLHLRLLRDGVTRDLADSAVKNLKFLGDVFAASGVKWQRTNDILAVQEPTLDDEFMGFSEAEEEQEDALGENGDSALTQLMSQLASIIRRELSKATTAGPRQDSALIPKTAALSLLRSLFETLPTNVIQQNAEIILSPLVHLTSPDLSITAHSTTEFKAAHQELIKNATELQDMLRDKLGTTTFVQALQAIRGAQEEKRQERRAKRKVDAVARPDVVAKKKAKRVERDKDRRREKNEFHRGRRRGW